MANKKPVVLITGVTGFAGRWCARYLAKNGMTVIGMTKDSLEPTDPLIKYMHSMIVADMSKPINMSLLPELYCDYILHLACITPQQARRFEVDQEDLLSMNRAIDANLLLLVKSLRPKRTLVVSSCAVYKKADVGLKETAELEATNSYEKAKLMLEAEVFRLTAKGYDILIARPFNHIGPFQTEGFFVPDMVRKIENLDGPILEVGNIFTQRDYVDVRDIASAYGLLLKTKDPEHTIFNVGTGVATTGEEILKFITPLMQKGVIVQSTEHPINGYFDIVVSDSTRLITQTGWRPIHTLNRSISDYLRYRKKPSGSEILGVGLLPPSYSRVD